MKKDICDKTMNFQECELAIIRTAIDKAEEKQGKKVANSPEIKRIIAIAEKFIKDKGLVCYGGTAINNILPKYDQFYNSEVEIPDYDFFSPNALEDAKELVDIYVKEEFIEVEAKSGQHHGTYKVFVNFIPVADITSMHKDLYDAIKTQSIRVAGIYYAPPNYLRMAMYLELSRPAGDVERWEKVLKRITLLNKHFPLKADDCDHVKFQREMAENKVASDTIYDTIRNTFIDQGVVFFGGYANLLYSRYMPYKLRKQLKRVPDFDVLSEEPEKTAEILKERLADIKIKNVKIVRQPGVGEIIAPNYEIRIGKDTVAFIYEPMACHSYNVIKIDEADVKVATIDTMLSFYLAFLYANRPYYDKKRILCMSAFLFEVQQQNRLKQNGLLKRFSINCYGHQETVEEMRAKKAEKYKELKGDRNNKEYEEWFLRYRPSDKNIDKDIDKDTVNKKKRAKISRKRKNTQHKTKKNSGNSGKWFQL